MVSGRRFGTVVRSCWKNLVLLAMSACIAASAGATAQRSFASPEAAAEALAQALKTEDRNKMLAVLGLDAGAWISSGDAAADRATVERFIAAYDAKHAVVKNGKRATLTLGENDFPFAFPIVHRDGQWRFDTAAGKDEMLARRIGQNELEAIKVLQAIVDAQMEYASEDRSGDGVLAYAQKFESSPGKRDGLYWPAADGEAPSPLGVLVAKASSEGYENNRQQPKPYHGYYYRLLSGQGRHAPSGALDYVVNGHAIGGFAVVAYPARYGNSGVMTFIVNQDGKIYQADLGNKTPTQATRMQKFDPGSGWTLVDAH